MNYREFKEKYNYNDPAYAFYYKFIKRPISYPLTWAAYHTSITPNQWSLIGFLFVFFSGIFLLIGKPVYLILAAAFFFIFELCDDFDGVIARSKKLTSKRGAWLDILCGAFGKMIILICSSTGLFFVTKNPLYLLLGSIALFGFSGACLLDFTIKVCFSNKQYRKLKFEEHKPNPHTFGGILSIISEMAMNLWYVLLIFAALLNMMGLFVWFSAGYYSIYLISQFLYRNYFYRKE